MTDGASPLPTPSPIPRETRWHAALRRIFAWSIWSRVVYGVAGVVFGVLLILELGYLGLYHLSYALSVLNPLYQAFWVSLEVVAVILPVGFGLGFVIGWARTTRYVILRGLGSAYVDFFRSMPPLALIFFFSLIAGLELRGSGVNPYEIRNLSLWMGVVALALHTAAYQAEIMRAGILSVPAGQTEAADAVGHLTYSDDVRGRPSPGVPAVPARSGQRVLLLHQGHVVAQRDRLDGAQRDGSQPDVNIVTDHYIYASLVIWFEAAILYFILTYIDHKGRPGN